MTLYTLANAHGMSASVTNYGGTVVKLLVPEPKFPSVVLKPGATYHSTIVYGFGVAAR